MKRYQVEIKPTAERDITKRYLQIAEDSVENATMWYLRMYDAISKLDAMAERCPMAPENEDIEESVRHLIVGDYRVLYTINNDRVDILHMRHSSMERNMREAGVKPKLTE